jgi:hypothetical protein
MIVTSKPLARRTVLRGGGFAVALPFLDAMTPRRAQAGDAAPRRFVTYFTQNGMYPPGWEPTGGETDFALSPVLQPFAPFRSHLTVLKGLDIMGNSGTCNHTAGTVGLLTGRPNFTTAAPMSSGTGISLDQYLAQKIGTLTRFPSLELAVSYDLYGVTGKRLSYRGPNQPVPPEANPYKLFARLFGSGNAGTDALVRLQRKRVSILDFVSGQIARMQKRLGAQDAQRLEWHASAIREIEAQLARLPQTGAACAAPDLGPPIPVANLMGYGMDPSFVPITKLQLDLLFAALACDMTRVATFIAGGGEHYFYWLGDEFRKKHHHDLSHEGDSNTDATTKITQINTWYAQQVAYLVGKMAAFREGAGTMLDNVVLLWGNQLARGNSHSLTDAPFFLLGKAGGSFKTGRFLPYQGKVPHNNLLVSILNAMGIPDTTFGQPDWCTGPLRELAP